MAATGKHKHGGKLSGKAPPPKHNKSGKAVKSGKGKSSGDFPGHSSATARLSLLRAADQRPLLIERQWRAERRHLFAVFVLAFILYALTAPHTVALEDDGVFIGNLHYFGVAHPPGYPLHTFFGGIFYHLLPFLGSAYKAHLFSGFAAACACACLYAVVIQLLRDRLYGYLAAGGYATSQLLWSQAIITEVYTLNAFIFFCTFALLLNYLGQIKHNKKLLWCLAAVYGLGLANHYPLLLLATSGLVLTVWFRLRRHFTHFIIAVAVAVAACVPLYAWMVWRSRSDALFNFYGPMETFDQFLFYVMRRGYSTIDKQADVDWADKLAHLQYLSDSVLWQYTPLGFIFILIGVLMMLRSRYNWLCAGLLLSFVLSSYFLIALLDFRSETLAFAVFSVYPVIAYGIMAIWLAVGAAWVSDNTLRRLRAPLRQLTKTTVVLLIIIANIAAHGEVNNRHNYRWAADFASLKLNDIKEEGAILFTYDDLDIPIGYLHYVEKIRPDITLYHDAGLMYANRLFHPLLPEYPPPEFPNGPHRADIVQKFVQQQNRPIYFHKVRGGYFGVEGKDVGFFRRYQRGEDNTAPLPQISDEALQWLRNTLAEDDDITDTWTRVQRYTVLSAMSIALQSLIQQNPGNPAVREKYQPLLDGIRAQNHRARILTDLMTINSMSDEQRLSEAQWLDDNPPGDDPQLDRFTRGRAHLLRAQLAERISGTDAPIYEASLLQALYEDSSPDNPGLQWLISHYAARPARHCDLLAAVNKYYRHQPPPEIAAVVTQIRAITQCPQ